MAESATAVGGSSTGVTLIVLVSLPVAPPGVSVAEKVTVRLSEDGLSLLFWYVTARSAAW